LGTTDGDRDLLNLNSLGNVGIGESNPKDDTKEVNGTCASSAFKSITFYFCMVRFSDSIPMVGVKSVMIETTTKH
jgi:hypothetical protein